MKRKIGTKLNMHTSKHLNVYEEAQTFMRNFVLKKFKQFVNKEIFHAFLFNIRSYSPEVRNIQRREMQLNITLPRVNNLNIKQKMAWNICLLYTSSTKQKMDEC